MIESTESIIKRNKAAGKSKEETWDECYGGVNMPAFVKVTLENDFNYLWDKA